MLKRRHTYALAFYIFYTLTGQAQIATGDAFYEKTEYIKAIPCYKKEGNKKKSTRKTEAFIKLANCYRFINDYANSEIAYRNAIRNDSIEGANNITPDVFYNYAQVLKTNAKYEEAAAQFAAYIKLAPNDQNARKAQRFCHEIKYYLTQPAEYTVKSTTTINTEKAEFCPFVFNNKLMFVAERESFDFVNYEVNNYDGQPFLNMYVSNIIGTEVKKSKSLSTSMNSEFHDGPACISNDGHTLYFTRVDNVEKKGFINQSKIYTAKGHDRTWKEITPINLNSDEYSIAHPSVSANDSILFFTSNMPGGFGGKDLYMSERSAEGWGPPINLGPDINTSGDEMFPSLRKDGILFFSSNGLPGFGGLDIYSAKKVDGKWLLQRNEGLELNSSTDDFGITFFNDSIGYFSSNRMGGKGNDDIYMYLYTNRSAEVNGIMLLTENKKDFAKDKKVVLLDEKSERVDSTRTTNNGYFSFKHLSAGKKYLAVLEEDDPTMAGKTRYFLADKDTVIQRVSHKMGNGRYSFKNLPVDPNGLPDIYTDDNLVFAGKLSSGDKTLGNVKMKILNEQGQVLEEVVTDASGNFVFKNIPGDMNYIVSVEENDIQLEDGSKITLTSKAGKEIKSFYKSKEAFSYKIIGSDKSYLTEFKEEEASPLFAGTLKAGDKALKNVKVKIVDENGKVLEEAVTDEKGNFTFKNIPSDKNYILSVDEGDVKLDEGTKVTLSNKSGKEIKSFYKSKEPFSFKVLPADKSMLSAVEEEDAAPPVFAAVLKSGDKVLKNVKVKIKNQYGEVVDEATTDENGNFVFRNIPSDKNYIISLDEEDVKLPEGSKITIASKSGKEVKTFEKAKENFEFKMLSSDKKLIDEMFVEDVDLVMGIYGYLYNQDKKPMSNAKITVKDADGSNARHLVTSDNGKFSFKNLNESKDYIFEADANEPEYVGVSRIYIADSKGRIYKVVELLSGKFAFKILDVDKTAMGSFEVDEPSLKMAVAKKKEKQQTQPTVAVNDTKKEPDPKKVPEPKEPKTPVKNPEPKKEPVPVDEEPEMAITIVENIYYAYGKYNITPDGERVLNKAVELLTENPKLIMEISSHTDSQSSAGFNLGLSFRRAQTAVDYLVEHGIARKRLKARGYGETRLLNHCKDGVTCSDEEHKINRRTEFKIVKPSAK